MSFWKTEKYVLKRLKNFKYCTTTQISFTRSWKCIRYKRLPVLSLCYKVKRIIRILIIALFFSASVARSQVSSKFPVDFSRKAAKKNTCYTKSLICSFWLHVILLYCPRHFRWGCSLHEERSNLTLSYKTKKERLTKKSSLPFLQEKK